MRKWPLQWKLGPRCLGVVALLLLGGCAPPGEDDDSTNSGKGKALPAASYPVKMELTNEDGKKLNVTVTGRTSTEVIFIRDGDTKPVPYEIAKLSKRDRRLIGALPEGSAPAPESPYVVSRRRTIAENERRMKELQADITGTSIANTAAIINSKKKKIAELQVENAELEQQIKIHAER